MHTPSSSKSSNKSLNLLAASVGIILAASTTHVMAQGFALYEPDIGTMGAAYAGAAATTDNASVVATNPAGMSRLNGINVTANGTLVLAYTKIKDPVGSAPGTNKGDEVPRILVGSTFFTYPHFLLDNLTFGLGVYAPYGLKTNYEDTFQGSAYGNKSTVIVTTLQPTFSYAFAPNLSVGAGLTINHMQGVLTNSLSPYDLSATQELDGSANALGYNLGILYSPIPAINLGLTYHSKVDYTLHGTAEIDNAPVTGIPNTTFFANGAARLGITTPDSVELAGTFKIVPTVDLKASILRTNWSTLKTLNPTTQFTADGIATSPTLTGAIGSQVNAAILSTLSSTSSAETLNFKDSNMYSVGGEWHVGPQLTLRAGFAYDVTPVRAELRNVRIPTANRLIYAVGANYAITDRTSVDLAYNYLTELNASINESNATKGIYQAMFENTGSLIAIQLNHRF